MTFTCRVTGLSLVEKIVKKVNLFCIFDQYDQRCTIILDHSSYFKDIYLMINLRLMDCNTENRETLITNFWKK